MVHRTYSSLVLSDIDLVGHVAYALYKRDKLKFCEEARSRTGVDPTAVELDVFIRACNIDTRLLSFRSEAERLLAVFAEFQLADATEEIQHQADERVLKKLSAGKSLWRVCGEALLGSVVVATVWAGMVAVILLGKFGPTHMIKVLTSTEVTSPQNPLTSSGAK